MSRRQMRLDHNPLRIGQISLITQRLAAMLLSGGRRPHGGSRSVSTTFLEPHRHRPLNPFRNGLSVEIARKATDDLIPECYLAPKFGSVAVSMMSAVLWTPDAGERGPDRQSGGLPAPDFWDVPIWMCSESASSCCPNPPSSRLRQTQISAPINRFAISNNGDVEPAGEFAPADQQY